jgi:hypothetical protein
MLHSHSYAQRFPDFLALLCEYMGIAVPDLVTCLAECSTAEEVNSPLGAGLVVARM